MLCARALHVRGKGLDQFVGQDGDAIFAALSVAHDELAALELDIFNAESHALEDAEAGSVQKGRHEPWGSMEMPQNEGHLLSC